LVILSAFAAAGMIVSGNAWAHHGGDRDGRGPCSEREGGWRKHDHRGRELAKALGLSREQKDRIKAIFKKNHDETSALRKEMVSERRELRNLIHSDKMNEAAIRDEAKKIAATSGDLAVRRAKMFQEVRGVLTPEQVRKFRDLRDKRDRGIDRMMNREDEGRPKGD